MIGIDTFWPINAKHIYIFYSNIEFKTSRALKTWMDVFMKIPGILISVVFVCMS